MQRLTMKAKKVVAEAAVSPFSALGCWEDRFKACHGMSARAPIRQGQQSPAYLDIIVSAFATQVEDSVRQIEMNRIFNADQTDITSSSSVHCRIYYSSKFLFYNCVLEVLP